MIWVNVFASFISLAGGVFSLQTLLSSFNLLLRSKAVAIDVIMLSVTACVHSEHMYNVLLAMLI